MYNLAILLFLCFFTKKSTAASESCPGPNEVYREGGACQLDCTTMFLDMMCTAQVVIGCYCKEGYVRNSQWQCIKVEQCYKDRCGANEFRDCGSACDTTCATLGLPCPIINIQCNDMCYCQEGFARDDCGKCIPVAQCPNTTCTGPNEEFSRNIDCTCNDLDQDSCNIPSSNSAGCRCIDGYVRNNDGVCIQAGLCPRCGPTENFAVAACPKTCKNQTKNKKCKSKPALGCYCKDGLVRNPVGLCVSPENCY